MDKPAWYNGARGDGMNVARMATHIAPESGPAGSLSLLMGVVLWPHRGKWAPKIS